MLKIHPCTPLDAPTIATLFLAAFSDPFNLTLFPRTPDVHAWWERKFARESVSPGQVLLKVADHWEDKGENGEGRVSEEEEQVVAFALWKVPSMPKDDEEAEAGAEEDALGADEEIDYPPSAPANLCACFFDGMAEMREKYMRGRTHYYLDILGTHPSHSSRGIASLLLRWGVERAEKEGLPVFLSASPMGRPMYERRGFRVVQVAEVVSGYVQAYMVKE